jgi:uncharacterized protein YjbI with pentapeptide repeats
MFTVTPRNSYLHILMSMSIPIMILTNEARIASAQTRDLLTPPECVRNITDAGAWTDKTGANRSQSDLQAIIEQHLKWLQTSQREGKQADLSGTKLKNIKIANVNLSKANLSDSDFSHADLTGTNLSETVLRRANLRCALLEGVEFNGADLTEVDLSSATLSNARFSSVQLVRAILKSNLLRGATFNQANLTEANLTGADLSNADFSNANLRNASLINTLLISTYFASANLEGADLFGATYEITQEPAPRSIAFSKNIEYMSHNGDSAPLARLRNLFKEAGFRDQERKITYVLKSQHAKFLWDSCEAGQGNCFEYWVNRMLFDLTSQYGMNPGRVLIIILMVYCISVSLYWGLIHFSVESGLSIVVPADRDHQNKPLWILAKLNQDRGQIQDGGFVTKVSYVVRPKDLQQFSGLTLWKEVALREYSLLIASCFFGLMSMFNIKFRDVDFGRWLRQLTTKEYDIKATGWARTVSGAQALLSVYLIALLLVSYFGRPFE